MNTQETISELTRCMKQAAEREEFESAHDFKKIRDGINEDQTGPGSEAKKPEEEDVKLSFGGRFRVLMDMNHTFAMIIDTKHPSAEAGKMYHDFPNLYENPEVIVVTRFGGSHTKTHLSGLCREYNRLYGYNENKG